jgi:hypothetical protein
VASLLLTTPSARWCTCIASKSGGDQGRRAHVHTNVDGDLILMVIGICRYVHTNVDGD